MVNLSGMSKKEIAKLFDYSILPKYTQEKEIREGCRISREYGFAAFYSSSPFWTPIIAEELKGTDIEIGTGIAFPFGSAPSIVKVKEVEYAVEKGCTAIDTVINVGALKDKRYDLVKEELLDFKKAAGDAVTKAILEVCFLTDEEIKVGCELIAETEIDMAKTSTGQFDGPSMKQFLVMKKTLEKTDVTLKVAGVKFPRPQNAYAFIMAGAERIGTRSAPEIVDAIDMVREIGIVPR